MPDETVIAGAGPAAEPGESQQSVSQDTTSQPSDLTPSDAAQESGEPAESSAQDPDSETTTDEPSTATKESRSERAVRLKREADEADARRLADLEARLLERIERQQAEKAERERKEQAERSEREQREAVAKTLLNGERERELLRKSRTDGYLTPEEEKELDRLQLAAETYQPLVQHYESLTAQRQQDAALAATSGLIDNLRAGLSELHGQDGIDSSYFSKAENIGAIGKYIRDTVKAAVEKPLRDRITELETELASVRDQGLGSGPRLETGGRTASLSNGTLTPERYQSMSSDQRRALAATSEGRAQIDSMYSALQRAS